MKTKPAGSLALLAALLVVAQAVTAQNASPSMGPHSNHDQHGAPPVAAQPAQGGAGTAGEGARPRHQAKAWTRFPHIQAVGRGERNAVQLKPFGMQADELSVYAPGGPEDRRSVAYPVTAEGASVTSAAPSMGNYHWVVARSETPEEVYVASMAWYFSNPGDAPTRLLRETRHELEIIPEPLPREHGSYRESEKWRFLVRWRGEPLPRQAVHLETEFGTRMSVVSDAAGIATIVFPRDHAPRESKEQAHGRPPRAKFVLATEKAERGRRYLTAFNHSYGHDTDRSRSLAWGAGFGLLGMGLALPLLRRRGTRKNGETTHA